MSLRTPFRALFLAILSAAIFSGCSDNNGVDTPAPPEPDKPFLTLKSTLNPFGSVGGSATLQFSTNEPWEITTHPQEGSPDGWYDVAPLRGDAGEQIAVTVSVDANEEYTGRGFVLVLKSTSLEERIEVTQLKKNAIIAGDNRREITSAEQTLTVEIQSNVSYGLLVKQGKEWIREVSESRAGGLEIREHTFAISANPDQRERTGIVVFKDANSELSDEVTIVQAAWDDPDPERSALTAIYEAANGGGWTRGENWCSDKPLGEWYGVETDAEGHVTALRLAKNNLTGTISWALSKLTHLRHLDLSWNALEGEVSKKDEQNKVVSYLDGLTEAETIDLSHNLLTGQFMPIDGHKLLRLQTLNLSFNRLETYAFSLNWNCMFENGRTVDLILNNNYLYGEIPDVIQNHPQWSRLALQFIRQYRGIGGGVSYTKDIHLPDFTFTDLRDGSQGNIRSVYSGNTLTMLLNWNPLDADSNTFLETTVRRFHTLFGGQGLAVVAITPEGEEYKQAAEQYLRTHDVPYPVVTDYADTQGRRIVMPAYPYPSYFFVDQYGKVTNDMFTGQYCPGSLYPEEPFTIDLTARPFQHTNYLNGLFYNTFNHSNYQSSDFSMDKKYETLQRATKGKGIDIVLIGEAFTDVDIATGYYKQVMEFAMESFFYLEPTKSYREYFNVYLVNAVSRDAYIGKSMNGSTALGVRLESGSQRFDINLAANELSGYYSVIPRNGTPMPTAGVIINGAGGGLTRVNSYVIEPSYGFTGFVHNGRRSLREIFIHETVGHGFGLLDDEYVRLTSPFQGEIPESEKNTLRSAQNRGWFLNVSLTSDPKSVYWAHLIGHPRYSYVGVYLGAHYYSKGVWKSENRSLMNHESDLYFNAICRELIVKRILELSGEGYTFEKFLDKDSDAGRQKSSTTATRQTEERQYRHQPPIIGD